MTISIKVFQGGVLEFALLRNNWWIKTCLVYTQADMVVLTNLVIIIHEGKLQNCSFKYFGQNVSVFSKIYRVVGVL